jgi:hypothetical protein
MSERKKCKHKLDNNNCFIDSALNNGPIKCWECSDYYAGLKGAVTKEDYEERRGDK